MEQLTEREKEIIKHIELLKSQSYNAHSQDYTAGFLNALHLVTLHIKKTSESKIEPIKDLTTRLNYESIVRALERNQFNKTKAAKELGIDRKTLYNKINKFKKLQTKNKHVNTTI